jgi:dipeptidase E
MRWSTCWASRSTIPVPCASRQRSTATPGARQPRPGASSLTRATSAGSRWGVLELTALSSIGEERWVHWVREADVLLVDGGDATYLCHWMRQSGLGATDDRTLGIVDFSIFPHLDNPDLPWNTMATAEEWAASLSGPAYAIDDETAFKVVDGTVEVISEGHWKLLTP